MTKNRKERQVQYFYDRNYQADIYNSNASLSNIKMMDNYINLVQIMSGNKYWYSRKELLLFNQMILDQEDLQIPDLDFFNLCHYFICLKVIF